MLQITHTENYLAEQSRAEQPSGSRSARQSREASEERSMEAKNGYSYGPLAGDDHEAAAAAEELIRATGGGFEGDDVKLRLLGYKQQLKRDLS
jgi:hypothetical protein